MYPLITPTTFMAPGLKTFFFLLKIYDVYHLKEWRLKQNESKNFIPFAEFVALTLYSTYLKPE